MKNFVIVSGGKISDIFAKQWITGENPNYIIAADSGLEFFCRTEMKPDMIIGDFDSVSKKTLQYFEKKEGIEWRKLNPMKDDTDTEYAIRLAIELGAKRITLLGATGSRLDHVLGNIELLGIGLQAGVEIVILDEHNRIRMISSSVSLKKSEQHGTYVSLLPYSSKVSGLTLKGFKYPLEKFTLTGFCSLGISNEIVDDVAEIIFEDGILIVVEARD